MDNAARNPAFHHKARPEATAPGGPTSIPREPEPGGGPCPTHHRVAGLPPAPGWRAVTETAQRLKIPPKSLQRQVNRLPEHARRKLAGRLWFDPRFMGGLALDLARANQPIPEPSPADMRPCDAERDSQVRRVLADAAEHAAGLRSKGITPGEADRIFAKLKGDGYYAVRFSVSTLARWRRQAKAGRGFGERRGRKRGNRSAKIGDKAWQYLVATILKLKTDVAEALRIAQGESLCHPGVPGWELSAHYSTVLRRFDREFPDFYREYVTLDPEKWAAKHLPKLDRRQNELPANLIWEIDGTPANALCRRGDTICRPQVVIVVCPASRMTLGVAAGPSESTELIRRASWEAYQAYGAPKTIRVDMGKAFAGQGFGDARRRKAAAESEVIGFAALVQAEYQPCTGRMGNQKGTVEGSHRGTDKHDRLSGRAYIGRNTRERSRVNYQWARKHIDKLRTIEQYETRLRAWWDAENRRPRTDMGKLSPLQKFEQTRIERRMLTKPAEEFLRRRAQRVRVGTKGLVVTIGGVRLHYGHRDPRVWERQGRELVAYIDEQDTSNILVRDEQAGTAFYLLEDALIGTDAASIREAGKLQGMARKRARQRFDDIDLAAAPTVDIAIANKRKAAEHAAAASEPAEIPEPGLTMIYTGLEEALKDAQQQEQQVLQTGTDATVEVTLRDVGLGQVMDDGSDDDPLDAFK